MTMLVRLRSLISARLASERGFAIPTVMLMTVAAMGMATVGVMASIQSQSGVVRDQGSKSAVAVAESGVEQALLHYNRGVPPCEAAVEGGWCGPVIGMSVNGGEVVYWARSGGGETCDVSNEVECVEIVSQGTVNGVTRRVDVYSASVASQGTPGGGPFSNAGVLSKNTLTLNANAKIHTGTATNGNIEITNGGSAKLCGPASVGIGKELTPKEYSGYYSNPQCTSAGGAPLEKELTLPPVNQGNAATENDNGRLFGQDLVSGKKLDACWSGFNAKHQSSTECGKERELFIGTNSAVTLGGTVYSFCKLTLNQNSALYVESGANVTIYFDSPEDCGYKSTTTQLELQSNTRISAATGEPVSIALLFVGSESIHTKIQLNSNTSVEETCDQNFIVYAPLSEVELASKTKFCGAIAGESVHLNSNAEIWSGAGAEEFEVPGWEPPETAAHYTPFRYVECSGEAAGSPNVGC
jgi:hypothetical protein